MSIHTPLTPVRTFLFFLSLVLLSLGAPLLSVFPSSPFQFYSHLLSSMLLSTLTGSSIPSHHVLQIKQNCVFSFLFSTLARLGVKPLLPFNQPSLPPSQKQINLRLSSSLLRLRKTKKCKPLPLSLASSLPPFLPQLTPPTRASPPTSCWRHDGCPCCCPSCCCCCFYCFLWLAAVQGAAK